MGYGDNGIYGEQHVTVRQYGEKKNKAAARCALDGGGARLSRCGRLRK